MLIRTAALAMALLGSALFAPPATAQIALGETGVTATGTAIGASDYLFRGISQTRSRAAIQSTAELAHSSGVYIGTFASSAAFLNTSVSTEVDLLLGYRFRAWGTDFDIGAAWYLYHGFNRRPGQFNLDYAEAVLKASHAIGPVTLAGTLALSPNYFASSGFAVYAEGGADWTTGFEGLLLGGRIGYQWIDRNNRFGTPDYATWSLVASRPFDLGRLGAVTASVGYFDTSISRGDCVGGQGICGARALAAVAWKF